MQTIANLQDIINNKAENRLNADIEAIATTIRDHRLLSSTNNPGIPDISMKLESGHLKTQKPYWFFQPNSIFWDKVKEHFLPIYITEETQKFVSEVDKMKNDVDNLMNYQYYE